MKTLSHFSPDDYEKTMKDDEFWKNKFMLDIELAKIKNGTAIFYTIEEVEVMLEKTISEYEN